MHAAERGGGWREVAGWICAGLFLLFGAVGIYSVVAFVYYRTTGKLLGDFTSEQFQWSEFGQLVLGTVMIMAASFWGAVMWLPADGVLEEGPQAGPPPHRGAATRTGTEHKPTSASPAKPSSSVSPPARGDGPSAARDEELLRSIHQDPQVEAMAHLIGRLLQEQEMRDQQQLAESERRSRRRDIQLLIVGTVLGLFTPALSGWVLGFFAGA